jgi:Domain of unknown function (DUF4062)
MTNPAISDPSRERAFRVFVSSTFVDMYDEREELIKRVFPELRKRCENSELRPNFGDGRDQAAA